MRAEGSEEQDMTYLTRQEAVAELIGKNCTEANANAILDHALAIYSQSHRTNSHMITGYRKRMHITGLWGCKPYHPGNPGIPEDAFTVCIW
jgi:hypothetical protein